MSASSSPELADEFEISSFDVAGFAASALRDWQSLAATIDHTLLKPDATSADIVRLCEEALHYRFACVSVNPCWIALAHSALSGSGVAVGTVVGFPLGASLTHNKREEAESALRLGARELDMVIHIGALKSGDNATVHSDVRTMVELAHDAGGKVKAILETCLLTLEEKLRASEICVAAGVDFLKTSTGFSSGGATVEDVSLLRGVAGGRCGVKASGGIRTLESVRDMLEAGASRIGTSSGVAILESYMEQQRAVEKYLAGQGAPLAT
ncbi:MAG: deoxyribose-phosphate aldolase [Acidobacteriota bacterium]